MNWYLSRRDLITFLAIIVIAETVFVLGDRGPVAYAIGLLFPLGVLLAINVIVGAATRSRDGRDRHDGQ
jgi:hypothetical protein